MPSRSREREDVLEQLDAQRRADAGHRLVEQHERGSSHQRAREVEQLALPARERAGVLVRVRRRDGRARALRARARARRARACARASRASATPLSRSPGWRGRREQHVVEHRHAGQRARRWIRADDACARDAVRRLAGRSGRRRRARGRSRA